jgi:hypothetical protein
VKALALPALFTTVADSSVEMSAATTSADMSAGEFATMHAPCIAKRHRIMPNNTLSLLRRIAFPRMPGILPPLPVSRFHMHDDVHFTPYLVPPSFGVLAGAPAATYGRILGDKSISRNGANTTVNDILPLINE